MTDLALLVSDLQRDEGWSGHIYDDATGAKIGPGSRVLGHPTAAWGFALDVAPLTQVEALPILQGRALALINSLTAAMPWISALSEPRQRSLANMAYNLGVAGLGKFTQFLGFMQAGQFDQAAADLAQTPWAKQVGDRATRIIATIRTGA